MTSLQIGAVSATLSPDDIRITPDDRQELIKTVEHDGSAFTPDVAVVDGGYCADGSVLQATGCKFSVDDFATVYGYYTNRTAVAVTLPDGTVFTSSGRVRLTQWTHNKRFTTISADLEVWKV